MLVKIKPSTKIPPDPVRKQIDETYKRTICPDKGTHILQDNVFIRPGEVMSQERWDSIFAH